MSTTREQALEAIAQAQAAMAEAVRLAEVAKHASTQAGILTAGDIIAEGIEAARADVFARLPQVASYVGTQCSQADVELVEQSKQEVIQAAQAAGATVAMCVKAALKIAAAI